MPLFHSRETGFGGLSSMFSCSYLQEETSQRSEAIAVLKRADGKVDTAGFDSWPSCEANGNPRS